jgi:hypothetical protein
MDHCSKTRKIELIKAHYIHSINKNNFLRWTLIKNFARPRKKYVSQQKFVEFFWAVENRRFSGCKIKNFAVSALR